MHDKEFLVETPDGEVGFSHAGAAADYLLRSGFANAQREPHWHLRWCLERMAEGELIDVGNARILRDPLADRD